MRTMASQITSLTIVYSTVYSDADQRKHQSSASLVLVRGIHWGPVNSPHKWPVTRKMFPFDDVLMKISCVFLVIASFQNKYKKNDDLKKDNYRPVSVLPSLSKVYERVMGQQLSDFFDKIFSALLSAFRKRYSCQSTLLNMIEHFKNSLDNSEYVACLSMDLSKAFDCLPHCLTICKMYSYGVSREACTLIASYLRDRKQRIKLGNTRSEWTELLKGVPQGSILGPLIFNIFLNDIFYFVSKGDLYNYADDNCISVSHKDISVLSTQLENETQVMAKWFADNSMKANADKFQGIVLPGSRNNANVQVSLGGVDIAFVKKIDVLGVCIDGKLNFNEHVHRICSKASAQISALQRLTGLVDYQSRKAIYTSFIASNFNYCPLVWFFTSRESINKIDKIQERADLFSRITPLVITIFYWNLGLIHLEYTLWSLSWPSYSKF